MAAEALSQVPTISLQANKRVVERFYDEAINGRDLGAVDRLSPRPPCCGSPTG